VPPQRRECPKVKSDPEEDDVKVDMHAHMIDPRMMGAAGTYGPEIIVDNDISVLRVGPYRAELGTSFKSADDLLERMSDPTRFIAGMDERGIDKVGVTVSPLFYLYWSEPEIGVPFSQLMNDCLADFCAHAPDRLFFIPTLPLQDVDASVAEVDRAIGQLGGKGINIGSDAAGRTLDDEAFWPVYERLQAHNVPIFIHPYPLPMADGVRDSYNLSWIVGYTYQETMAFAHLVLGGVFDDFPDLRVYITHGGGAVPYQIGRIEEAFRTMPGVRAKKSPRDYLRNFYFDILVHDLAARRFLVEFMGVDNLVVGDNYQGWDATNGFELLEELGLDKDAAEKIAGGNAMKLFGL
jgi:aminocarboxymuconate-semialdehyde decarboxylase